MKTDLDSHHELELESIDYDGHKLIVEVSELVVGTGGRMSKGTTRFSICFLNPVAHAVTEEFSAAMSTWIQGIQFGFLRSIENPRLRATMGLDHEQFDGQFGYALITAHEVVVVYCSDAPIVTALKLHRLRPPTPPGNRPCRATLKG